MNRSDLHPYQTRAVDFICDKRRCGLFLDMGLGKTVSTLTAISDLTDACIIKRTLIIAPLRVCNSVWAQEGMKWGHLHHLKISVATGSINERRTGLNTDADVFVINRENTQWLVNLCAQKKIWPFDCVVVDESSSFKNPSSKRFQALKKVLPRTSTMILLSGTPAPNSLIDLWSQIYLIDQGETLGKNITAFRRKYCEVDFWGHQWSVKEGYGDHIKDLIKPMCLSMAGEDYLELPDRIDITEKVVLPPAIQDQYKDFEKKLFMEHDGVEVEAMSAAVLANKLLQFSNGAIYIDEEHNWKEIHTAKLDALLEIIEENSGENILVPFNYHHDRERIMKRFPSAVLLDKNPKTIDRWNSGKIKMLICHPGSAGHGLNLQSGGSMIVWFGRNWGLEYDKQLNARLHRQGQEKPVRVVRIVCADTIDQRVLSVLSMKDAVQNDLLNALRG